MARTQFEQTNNFFIGNVYNKITDFAFLPTKILELVVDKNKRLSQFTATELATTAILGVLVVFPLTLVTLDLAFDLFFFAAMAHLGAAITSILLDANIIQPRNLARI